MIFLDRVANVDIHDLNAEHILEQLKTL